jgi:hypothetical protein
MSKSDVSHFRTCLAGGGRGSWILPAVLVVGWLLSAPAAWGQTGAYTLNGGTKTETSITETTSTNDQSGIFVYNGGSLTVGTVAIRTSGDATDTNKSGQYGVNAGILAGTQSSKGTIVITGTGNSITTTGSIANGLFATGSGSSISMNGGTIEASGANAHGVDVTFGGSITLTDVDITTRNGSSSALATDFGGGTVTVTGGTIVAADTVSGSHSAGIYSTGTISVTGATVSSAADLGGVIDGANSILLTETSLTGAIGGIRCWKTAPVSGEAIVTVKGGSLTATTGDAFIVTGSTGNASAATITVSDGTVVRAGSGILLNVDGGSTATFTAKNVTLSGDVTATGASKATVALKEGASLTGMATNAALSLDASSTWVVTANSVLTTLSDASGISGLSVTNITGNGHIVTYDSSLSGNSPLGGKTYSLVGGGVLMPAGTPLPVPAVTSVDPASGPTGGGTEVTIAGTALQYATGVTFGETAAASFEVRSDSTIHAVAPAHAAGAVHISVANPAGTSPSSSGDLFTYEAAACSLTCSATAPTLGTAGAALAFAATATATGCDGTPAYAWAYGDGATSSEQNPSHAYASAGAYTWTLTVTVNGTTCLKSGSLTVTSGASLPGDCNGDGTVSIGEVQRAINMFLGLESPSCGADCNGDGTVSIGEIQKVINAFLGLAISC